MKIENFETKIEETRQLSTPFVYRNRNVVDIIFLYIYIYDHVVR